MQQPLSLKAAERRAFKTTFSDGLWDILIGCFVLMLAVAPLLSVKMGDFWSSAIFLPFWGLVYLAIRWARMAIVAPRIGTVRYGKMRQQRLRKFTLWMVGFNALLLGLGILALVTFDQVAAWRGLGLPGTYSIALGLALLVGFSLAAYLLDFTRLYVYGALLFVAPVAGEWLRVNFGAAHHGFPIAFGFSAGMMILIGIVLFARILSIHPADESEGG